MYKNYAFAVLFSITLLSPAFGTNDDPNNEDHNFVQKRTLADTLIREDQKILEGQKIEYLNSLRQDKEKDANLSAKIAQLIELKKTLLSRQKEYENIENEHSDNQHEQERLAVLLVKDPNHKSHRKRQTFLECTQKEQNKRAKELQANIYQIQKEVVKLEDSIGEDQIKIITETCDENAAYEDIAKGWYKGQDVYERKVLEISQRLNQALNLLANDVLSLVFLSNAKIHNEQWRSEESKVTFPEIWKMRLVSKKWKAAAENFIRNKNIVKELKLSPRALAEENLPAVLSVIQLFSIQSIDLTDWNDRASSYKDLPKLLSEKVFLATKTLSYIGKSVIPNANIKDQEGTYLVECFKSLPNLEYLYLSSFFSEEEGKLIVSSFRLLSNLKSFSLESSGIGPLVVKDVAKNLKFFPRLVSLYMAGSNPGDVGAIAIAKNMSSIPELQRLDLSGFEERGAWTDSGIMRELGLTEIINACQHHPTLTYLNVRGHATKGLRILDNVKNINGIPIEIIK